MSSKTVFVFAMVLIMVATTPLQSRGPGFQGSRYNLTEVSVISLEESCVRQGGICMRVEDCAPENVVGVQVVLCPNQHHKGVVCCYS
ncbi:uncharacterized protein LOC131849340 [Achroia grisella]|uniref:uncharacterized protein LOC131849340 n=1 Tax=Achroia grisella TaxID=688607 RepID=UPI0027D339E1|nr:uncharacterized protein LOC131849340 [Achroia grisella]